jgi:DNA-binding LytR/AlgR family response regulator
MVRKIDISEKQNFCLKDVLLFPYRDFYMVVNTADIMYLKAEKAYSRITLSTGVEYLISRNIKYIKKKLPVNFIRSHNSYLINIFFAESLTDDGFFILKNKFQIPISRRKKKDIVSSLSIL